MGLTFNPFPKVNSKKYFFFKEFLQVERGSESSIEKVTFLGQPTHFHLKQFLEDNRGSATIRFFDLQKKQLFSEFQIEKHL